MKKKMSISVPPHIIHKFEQALQCFSSGKAQEAVNICQEVIKAVPKHADAYHLIGVILSNSGQFVNAMEFYNKSIEIYPDNHMAFCNRGNAYHQLKQPELGLEDLTKSIELKPDYAEAYYNRGIIVGALHRTEEEIEMYDLALKYKPNFPEAYNNKGIALQKLHRMEETLANYEAGIAQNPQHIEAFYNNRGLVLQNLMRIDEALADYNKALEVKPDLEDCRFNRSMCLLLKGEYDTAWKEHEWRWNRAVYPRKQFPGKAWLGEEDLKNQVLFIYGEQGLGDMLQFSRYVNLAKERGAIVMLGLENPLVRICTSLKGVDAIVTPNVPLPHFDYHIPIISLPLAFGTDSLDKIPNEPYLKPNPETVAHFAKRLGKKTKKRVGIVWSGGYRPDQPEVWAVNERRNIALEKLVPLQHPDIEFFSIQLGEPAVTELANSKDWDNLINLTHELKDFEDTAGLIENLDLVIAVDTSTAHLAGAMGKPVWLMNRFDTCWRWLMDRSDSPWYPSFTIYRQPKLGDWNSVIEAIKKDLHK
jgi:tetratricopeptide (TPR) repeat protein